MVSLVHGGDRGRVCTQDEVDFVAHAGGVDVRLRLGGVAVPKPVHPKPGSDIQVVVDSHDPYRRRAVVPTILTLAADTDFLLIGDLAESFWFPPTVMFASFVA